MSAVSPRDLSQNTRALEEICEEQADVDPKLLEEITVLAVEIAREGREGRKIGTLFTVGDAETVLEHSRTMILDPLAGHPDEKKRIDEPNLRETVKELAQLDGAFVVDDRGVFRSAARYLDAPTKGINLPLGLGSRHMAGAAISKLANTVAIVVSESSVVRLFSSGELLTEIVPEIWMLHRYGLAFGDRARAQVAGDMTVVSK